MGRSRLLFIYFCSFQTIFYRNNRRLQRDLNLDHRNGNRACSPLDYHHGLYFNTIILYFRSLVEGRNVFQELTSDSLHSQTSWFRFSLLAELTICRHTFKCDFYNLRPFKQLQAIITPSCYHVQGKGKIF